MARIDTKNLSDSLKYFLEKEAAEKNLSLNKLTKEIFEDYTKDKLSFESEKRFNDSINQAIKILNKNTETVDTYIKSNAKLIEILTEE
ncbi:hypothetical protein [Carnobacterium inhibens]|uniref:Uncharacterized protein n=1 Tax=Carnobacterium inhibens subsp. gilichinskyi TaxID=1266845 RepID=U5SDB4_9LACT|nr:hypothetical protein [Carnobacterium inhibens]AGY83046.1 hypothetical protein Q783_12135 [Carnobacterium inhibens subsp. gilichinskyi]